MRREESSFGIAIPTGQCAKARITSGWQYSTL